MSLGYIKNALLFFFHLLQNTWQMKIVYVQTKYTDKVLFWYTYIYSKMITTLKQTEKYITSDSWCAVENLKSTLLQQYTVAGYSQLYILKNTLF
jgi:hypothetical protein